MTTSEPQFVTSPSNALVKDLRRLAQDTTAYRKQQRVWLEGDHLCRAALDRGLQPAIAVFSESLWNEELLQWQGHGGKTVVVADAIFATVSGLESPSRMGFVVDLQAQPTLKPGTATVVLDGLQDPGNVGAILRSAAAFGFRQIIAIRGTAALWSPKVLRAGMGAHFGLHLLESMTPADVQSLEVPVLVTSSHRGEFLHKAQLPWPCAWVLGHEGQGVSEALEAIATTPVRIAQPGGEESLNVASAAAICLHASAASRA